MITTMRGCVAHNDLWPWPISSRSFGLDLENRVRSVASTVLDGFFLYSAQMITMIRGCVACYDFFRIWKFEFLANFWNFPTLTLKKKSTVLDGFFPYFAQMITNMRGCVAYNDLWPWPISSRSFGLGLENRVRSVASTVLDGFFQGARPPPFFLLFPFFSSFSCYFLFSPFFLLKTPINSSFFRNAKKKRRKSVLLKTCIYHITCASW